MKKCPKCGADNRPDSSVCFSCFARIDGVQDGSSPIAPSVTAPVQPPYKPQPLNPSAIPQPPTQPVDQFAQPVTPPPAPYPQSSLYGQPPYPRRAEYPIAYANKKSNVGIYMGIFVFLVILITGGIFSYWHYNVQPETPVGAVRIFIKATEKGDRQAATKCLSARSMQLPDFVQKMDKMMEPTSDDFELSEGAQYILESGPVTETSAVVYMKLPPAAAKKLDDSSAPSFMKNQAAELKRILMAGQPIYLIKEDKKWKIDLGPTVTAMEKLENDLTRALGSGPNQNSPVLGSPVPGMSTPSPGVPAQSPAPVPSVPNNPSPATPAPYYPAPP
jgi:hypothetical protein